MRDPKLGLLLLLVAAGIAIGAMWMAGGYGARLHDPRHPFVIQVQKPDSDEPYHVFQCSMHWERGTAICAIEPGVIVPVE
jgi:hypothetical protein